MRRLRKPEYVPAPYWDQVASRIGVRTHDAGLIAGDNTDYYQRKRAMFLDRLLAPATADARRVLEVGCGPGGNLAWLVSRGKEVAGADVSPCMLRHARQLLPGTPLTLIDGSRLPFADSGIESAMTVTVLQHNTPAGASALARELARVAASEVHLFEDTAWLNVRDHRSHWLRTPRWYADRMSAAGFDLVLVERLPLAAQEIVAALVRTAWGPWHPEGERETWGRHVAEVTCGGAARIVDAVVPGGVGLTRMSFRRPAQPSKPEVG
jgi:SAM-dependent methyltransferase